MPGFQTELEILGSLWELPSGLAAVHEYYFPLLDVQQIGCHFDIKPGNILYYNRKLVLADFGLSSLRRVEEGSQIMFRAGEGNYMAPECESIADGFEPGKIGRASDVWSFGCVLAEILAYLNVEQANGRAAIEKFDQDRRRKVGTFVTSLFYGDNELNPGVQRLLDSCRASLLDGVRSLAEVVDRILQYEPSQRPSASEITRLLFHLTQRSRITAITTILSQDFEPLDLELEIERERFKVWSQTVAPVVSLLETSKSPMYIQNDSLEKFENLRRILVRTQTEVSAIATELKTVPGRPAFHLYYRLQKLQDQLWDGQPLIVRRRMSNRLEETMLNRDHLEKPQGVLESTSSVVGQSRSSPSELLCRRFVYLAMMRNVASALVRQDHQMQDNRLDRASIKGPLSDLGPHAVGTLDPGGERILIEFLNYGKTWASRENDLLERVNAVACLRSKGVLESIFPILQCRGYYHDPSRSRFGIVYQMPLETNNSMPMNLLTIFSETKVRLLQPSLTQRFKLASTLVSHVLSFHRGNWLHRSICPLSIICFPNNFSTIAASLSKPYFIGFNHSRANDDVSYSSSSGSEWEYQHPLYQRNTRIYTDDTKNTIVRYRQEFDYYSVGMVLVEIALWKPLSSMTGDKVGSPEDMLKEIQRKYVPLVTIHMGDVYCDAVKYCLNLDVGQKIPKEVRESFNAEVVLPISKCLV